MEGKGEESAMRYIYCPKCGSQLKNKPAGDDGEVPFCDSCGQYWFDSFSSVAIVLVANEHQEIAMLRQNYLSKRYWNYVAGFIKPGETAEETAVREVREELGLSIDHLEFAGTYWFGDRDQLILGFIGLVRKADFSLSVEVDAAEWIQAGEAPGRMFPDRPGNCQHPMYRKYLQMIKK